MSYILSALRKAERERQTLAPHRLEDFLAPLPAPLEPQRTLRPAILFWVLLPLMAALAGWWLSQWSGRVPQSPVPSSPPLSEGQSALVGESRTSLPLQPIAESAAGSQLPSPAESHKTLELQPAASETSTPGPQAAPLPALNVTGYLYFESTPQRSKLLIDGVVYRQQSRILPGLLVSRFLPHSVVLSWHGEERHLPIP